MGWAVTIRMLPPPSLPPLVLIVGLVEEDPRVIAEAAGLAMFCPPAITVTLPFKLLVFACVDPPRAEEPPVVIDTPGSSTCPFVAPL